MSRKLFNNEVIEEDKYIFVPRKRQRRESSIKKEDAFIIKKLEERYDNCMKMNAKINETNKKMIEYKELAEACFKRLQDYRELSEKRIKKLEDIILQQTELIDKCEIYNFNNSFRSAKRSKSYQDIHKLEPIKSIL